MESNMLMQCINAVAVNMHPHIKQQIKKWIVPLKQKIGLLITLFELMDHVNPVYQINP